MSSFFYHLQLMEHQWNESDFVHHKSHMDVTWDRTRAFVVRGRRLTAWAMARPCPVVTSPDFLWADIVPTYRCLRTRTAMTWTVVTKGEIRPLACMTSVLGWSSGVLKIYVFNPRRLVILRAPNICFLNKGSQASRDNYPTLSGSKFSSLSDYLYQHGLK
jgi:hypothetical protein